MPWIFAHRNRAVLPWIWFRQIIEHMTLWGQECWRKQRRVKSHGKIDRLPMVGQSLCWYSPAEEFSPMRKKISTLTKEGLKYPGRKCSHEGLQVHREEATLRGNQALCSVLQHPHQNQTALAPVATTSPATVVPGLVLTGRKALEHHPSASQSKFTVRPDAPVLKLYSCQVSPCRNF